MKLEPDIREQLLKLLTFEEMSDFFHICRNDLTNDEVIFLGLTHFDYELNGRITDEKLCEVGKIFINRYKRHYATRRKSKDK